MRVVLCNRVSCHCSEYRLDCAFKKKTDRKRKEEKKEEKNRIYLGRFM